MKKREIGKIQLIVGIVILVLGVLGLVYSVVVFNKMAEYATQETSGTTGDVAYENPINTAVLNLYTTLEVGLLSTSIVLLFLSILFITQGLVNMSEK